MKLLPVFVYGTLMQGYGFNHVLDGLPFDKALLKGYHRIWTTSMPYPIIVTDSTQVVEGELYSNTSRELVERLDFIEGEGNLYHRITVQVEMTRTGKVEEAYCYYPGKKLLEKHQREIGNRGASL